VAEEIFCGLAIGGAAETLDDGEAASIALASALGIAVVIDEGKANKLCVRRFPELVRLSSGDMFLHDAVTSRLGEAAQRDAVFNALIRARMRVQQHHLQAIKALLDPVKLQLCLSLPACMRRHPQEVVKST
jgi:predicted nucleic acid-binding protein